MSLPKASKAFEALGKDIRQDKVQLA